jgi:hypothetical protein
MPFYIQMLFIVTGIIIFPFFFEGLFFALFIDTIFSIPIEGILNFQYINVLILGSVFIVVQAVKNIIR